MLSLAQIPQTFEGLPIISLLTGASLLLFLCSSAYSLLGPAKPWLGFPVMSLDGLSPRRSWIKHGNAMMQKGLEQHSGPFQCMTGIGPRIVLPNRFADEIRNNPNLSLSEAYSRIFFSNYPGFEGFRSGTEAENLIQDTIRLKLTQSLALVTDSLVEETIDAVHDIFGEDEEWQTGNLRENCLELVSRLSSRVFLGKTLCRDRDWLKVTKGYSVDAIDAARELRMCPPLLRRILMWVLPGCTNIRKQYRDATKLIMPEVELRKAATEKTLAAGGKPPKVADAIGWMTELSKGKEVDYVGAQLALSIAAIHTTTEGFTQALMDLCEHPELIQELREETIMVLGPTAGWAKTSLYQLRLMDSFLKESQRLHRTVASMSRLAMKDIQLSDGTILPRGCHIVVGTKFFDPVTYPDPMKFDPSRFLRKREEAGQANSWQYATTSPAHLGFGHGEHACPGRFFVASEIKIALCHLLLKYDWDFVTDEGRKASVQLEGAVLMDPRAQIRFRRRREEIDLSGERAMGER